MAVEMREQVEARAPLSRRQVLRGAVRYVDEHGLDALSMHKLGADLGVKGMSLYRHVTGKDDLLDGIVEELWTEIPLQPAAGDWRAAVRGLAEALRGLVHRHPHAAPLLTSRQTFQERPLRIAHSVLTVMREGGVPEQCAVALLRTVFPYGIGYALAELSIPQPCATDTTDGIARIRQISGLLSPHAPDDLVRTALLLCDECDLSEQFDIGLDLMIHGLDAYLETLPANLSTAAAH
ncbi:MAG TPA: TetR/AcrR family transcriptional regulator C-terminal domain-containing protein [Pseudonocardiaceae bacterium]|nr:TetR/AcrR family transcriptional regulator C-terminal domain-containing protein [Pseudonocardiaceae bacterium]